MTTKSAPDFSFQSYPLRETVARRMEAALSTSLVFVALLAGSLSSAPVAGQTPERLDAALALQQVVVDAIADNEQSVVAIARVPKQELRADGQSFLPFNLPSRQASPTDPGFIPNEFGAGVVIDDAGLILTTNHVLGNVETSDYYVWSQRKPFKAEVLATAPWFDLAVLKIDSDQLQPIALGDASELQKGQIVIALGNPYAIARDGSVSASWGIISNLTRRAPSTPTRSNESQGRETLHHHGTLIQTDARLNMGYSGGALRNLDGKMIGLTTSYTAGTGYEVAAGLAIPVDAHFKRVVDSLRKGESPEFGFLGVAPEPLDASLRRQGFHGARVVSVFGETPADKADLRPDDVITQVNGVPVYDDNDLFREVGSLRPGVTAVLTIKRGEITAPDVPTIEAEVVVSKKYVSTMRSAISTAQKPLWRGMRVDYATASATFNQPLHQPPADSLFVVTVQPDSPAWQAGVRPGEFVTHVGDRKVTTPAEFTAAVAGQAGEVTLHATRDGRESSARTISP